MANNQRVSRSASVEDLREKNIQMEAKPSKLAEEMRDVMKKHEENSKRQEESQRRMEEANQVLDDKLSNLSLMMERTIRQISGYQCADKVMKLAAESDEEVGSEEELEVNEQEDETVEIVEQAMLFMYAGCDKKKWSSMKFKGHIGKIPICALLDSGSTHSFVSPVLVKRLRISIKHTNPMVVKVANGESMVTNATCQSLQFDFQGHKFEKEVRLLAIQGYDLILALDRLTSLGPRKIYWGEDIIEFKLDSKEVELKVREEVA